MKTFSDEEKLRIYHQQTYLKRMGTETFTKRNDLRWYLGTLGRKKEQKKQNK